MKKRDADRPDVEKVLATLKDFQRKTVDHAFQRMYLDDPCTHRLLIADEVGLGKTMVARGIIAKAIDRLWDTVDRIDVVYVCSNAEIARQNVNRLNITGRSDFAIASRITMLPTEVHDLRKRPLNFVSLTPGTSMDLAAGSGHRSERVLLYHLLDQAWGCKGTGPKNLMQGYVGADRFRDNLKAFDVDSIDESIAEAFVAALENSERQGRGLRGRFEDLCKRFQYTRQSPPAEDRKDQNALIGDLRALLARTCIEALQPDLVVLDEFQRFKHLLSGDSEAAQLAHALFDYSDHQGKARVLLLSATPYKMYTLTDESDTDDHYADFLLTLRFLQQDATATERVDAMLKEFRRMLTMIGIQDHAEIVARKQELEAMLRQVIVRTERLSATSDRSGMLTEHAYRDLPVEARDFTTYRAIQNISRIMEREETVEYWKAAPYLLNFMDEYKLKAVFREMIPNAAEDLVPSITASEDLLLPRRMLHQSPRLDPPHARLRWLIDHVMGGDEQRLLWVPPSLPYYGLADHFERARARGHTKHLIFSAWRVVPKAIAALLSYEAERRILSSDTPRVSLNKAREGFDALLRFAKTEDRLVGMPLLALLYPSTFLARVGDSLGATEIDDESRSLEFLIERTERTIASALHGVTSARSRASRVPDESWYWAAPLLLDEMEGSAKGWLSRRRASIFWRYGPEDSERPEDGEDGGAWSLHVEQARQFVTSKEKLGTPPDDLARVMALVAIAGPAVTALRALARRDGAAMSQDTVRDAAGKVAFGFRSLFNLPEATAIVRGFHPGEPYWQRVLEYAAGGGLQPVLDEYVHVLRESEGLVDKDLVHSAPIIASVIAKALELRAAVVGVDEIKVDSSEKPIKMERRTMRSRFAARFGAEEEAEAGGERSRSDQVRVAFNSPFWPFVLASTSVGQEGLDFHQYCHAVVHWNLPANPVDLEQREGRIHRYKGHAVRKNVALRFGLPETTGEDPWQALFNAAKVGRNPSTGDLVPFWLFPVDGGARIERHVPMLPLSREIEKLAALRRALAVYRMVFGQPRQEELVDYLVQNVPAERVPALMEELRIDLSPPSRDNPIHLSLAGAS